MKPQTSSDNTASHATPNSGSGRLAFKVDSCALAFVAFPTLGIDIHQKVSQCLGRAADQGRARQVDVASVVAFKNGDTVIERLRLVKRSERPKVLAMRVSE